MTKKYDRSLLEQVAAEMNAVMCLTPPMEFTMPDDDTLLETIIWWARGQGEPKDAIRADDFIGNPDIADKQVFTKKAWQFFVDIGVWDNKAAAVIMERPAGRASAPAAPAADKTAAAPSQERAAEQEEQNRLEVGETTGEDPALVAPARTREKKTAKAAAPAEATPAPRQAKGKAGKAAPAAPAGQAPEKQEAVMKTQAAVRGAVSRKTATAKKRASKSTAAQRNATVKREPASLDAYGFRVDSMSSKALALFTTHPGKYTMKEAMKKLESKCDFSYAFKKAKHVKITIDKETGKISAK